MSYSVVLVGLGQVAMGYDLDMFEGLQHSHARAFSCHPKFNIVGGVDPSSERCQIFSERFGVQASPDLEVILGLSQPDIVIVASPTETHFSVVKSILDKAVPRIILCEKPLSYRLTEAREIINLCKKNGCELYVNYSRRANPGVLEVKRRISDGRIPAPLKGVVWYSKGLLHNGSHFFDLLEFWLGAATGFTLIRKGRWLNENDPEPDIRFDFTLGSVIFLATNDESFSLHEIDLVSSSGRLRYLRGGSQILWQETIEDPIFPEYRILSEPGQEIETYSGLTQGHVVAQLAEMLDGGAGSLCSGESALEGLEWLMKVRKVS